jgi:hypothetical protein
VQGSLNASYHLRGEVAAVLAAHAALRAVPHRVRAAAVVLKTKLEDHQFKQWKSEIEKGLQQLNKSFLERISPASRTRRARSRRRTRRAGTPHRATRPRTRSAAPSSR